MANPTPSALDGKGNGTCPVLENPDPDCYCLNMTSLIIQRAVQYCLTDFRKCPIYMRTMGFPES